MDGSAVAAEAEADRRGGPTALDMLLKPRRRMNHGIRAGADQAGLPAREAIAIVILEIETPGRMSSYASRVRERKKKSQYRAEAQMRGIGCCRQKIV
jgi:hypothetical protein